MFRKDVSKVMKNIYVSRAISKLEGRSQEYINFLEIFSHKHSPEVVRAALKELYTFNGEIKDIERITAAMVIKHSHLT